MRPNEYQELASKTALKTPPRKYTDEEIMIIWNSMGLAGEVGETVDYIKKSIFHGHRMDKDRIKEELGDIQWYLAELCSRFGFELEEVMASNIDKLKARYPEGFSTEAPINRVENKR